MKLEHESPQDLTNRILKVLGKHLDLQVYKPFYFGSRVDGTASEHSDIDLGIIGPAQIPAKIWSDVIEAIEDIPVLYTIDVVDFARASEEFKQVAMQATEFLIKQ